MPEHVTPHRVRRDIVAFANALSILILACIPLAIITTLVLVLR